MTEPSTHIARNQWIKEGRFVIEQPRSLCKFLLVFRPGNLSFADLDDTALQVLLLPMGILCDSVPIMGMHRKPYLLILALQKVVQD